MKIGKIISAIFGREIPEYGKNRWAGMLQPKSCSGRLHAIQRGIYNRIIFAKNTTDDYIIHNITEYGDILAEREPRLHDFWMGKSGVWHIIKVGKTINFYTYHNLVCWLTGYDDNPDAPDFSIGFARHMTEPAFDCIFHLDPDNASGDTEIGVFRNGKSFHIYLPEAYEETLTITDDYSLTWNRIAGPISRDGLDISKIDLMDFVEYKIKMKT